MLYFIVLLATVCMAIVTSAIGASCLLRGSQIYDLNISIRNFMYIGACCAMVLGFLGATLCIDSLVITHWNYVGASILGCIGVFATAHISVDLSDRLRILKR